MSGKDRQDWDAMLQADPGLKAAWDSYLAQLERDATLVGQGVQPTGQAMTAAARRVLIQATLKPANNDN